MHLEKGPPNLLARVFALQTFYVFANLLTKHNKRFTRDDNLSLHQSLPECANMSTRNPDKVSLMLITFSDPEASLSGPTLDIASSIHPL
jgi:hypothetical protein